MPLGQPLAQARRQQQLLIAITREEVLRHPEMVLTTPDGPGLCATATMQGDSGPRWRVRAIAAAVFLGDDAIAALAVSLTCATRSSGLAAHTTRVATALTRALTHHP